MRFLASKSLIGIMLSVAVSSCAPVTGVEHTDLRPVKQNASRSEIETVLGEPVSSKPYKGGEIVTYHYDEGIGRVLSGQDLGYAFMMLPISVPIIASAHDDVVQYQRGLVHIIYGPDGLAKNVEFVSPRERRRSQRELERAHRLEEIREDAVSGDAQAQYELWQLSSQEDKNLWLCTAAHNGHPMAQIEMGRRAWYGVDDTEEDHAVGFMWYSLADRSGHLRGRAEVAERRQLLTQRETEEADSLIRSWRPQAASCS